MKFAKYHALGNDYLVLSPPDWAPPLSPDLIRTLCDRHFGIGSDGILLGPLPSPTGDCALRIFNPDGSEAEKSGNGLRIFARFLWDIGRVGDAPFTLDTAGGAVQARVLEGGRQVEVEMGRIRFSSDVIPVAGPPREVINETVTVGGRTFQFCAASIGNPHCVIPVPEVSAQVATEFGPLLETHPLFPNRTNVQFMTVRDRNNIQIEIWERGAGYTLASGSSSSAAAAVAHRLGFCDRQVAVHMPGGVLRIEIGDHYAIRMIGPVRRVAEGHVAPELIA